MKKDEKIITIVIILAMIVVIGLIGCILFLQSAKEKNGNKNESKENVVATKENVIVNEIDDPEKEIVSEIVVVPTMEDEISSDTVWCPTFQLVWNDLKKHVGDDIKFINPDEDPDYLDNLNDELFKEEDISDEYYYKKWGLKSNDLKEEILDGIKEKFDEKSDVISPDDDWGEKNDVYIFYAMLKRVFEFKEPFDILNDGFFDRDGKNFSNVKYFGIDSSTSNEIRKQVKILYYKDYNNFAISIDTKNDDEVIFAKGVKGKNFADIYKNIQNNESDYNGSTELASDDKLNIPNLKFNVNHEYAELESRPLVNGEIISKAIQTIQLELDNEGGKIKSEAVVEIKDMARKDEKNLLLDDEFVMFVKEKDKDKPYFALNVSDISKFQEDVTSKN